MWETISFHITKHCNLRCKFCYATFDDFNAKTLSLDDCKIILDKLKSSGLQKITFAGGEPLIYPYIKEAIIYAHKIGLVTSIITNGVLLKESWLIDMKPYLNWVGISIDSLNEVTNNNIGRSHRNYPYLCTLIQSLGYKLKINTVINNYNKDEDFNEFVKLIKPDRWKVFQVLRVGGQNDKYWNEIKISDKEYNNFISKHINNKMIVPENNNIMRSSYLLIDCMGRFFDDTKNVHTYSKSILITSVKEALKDISINRESFIKRGGLYNW